ncbi:heterokaryon incompatibility protein-domain-containing protein [Fusarium solani]|uniref:Heterokaryon incompatibility protein-domain-containing protein n=1 Tax=Fusarium solani TaxID=169388 RepID=A0A9P9KIU6_FUSSL|nr:heterokaryon incompatibility protein-domain-containing protein [Fusarium solani]KAH7264597.1 heterokaryon incompatibility protein-domain-containing protein [Fusarium solani]
MHSCASLSEGHPLAHDNACLSTNTRVSRMAQDGPTSREKGECLACGLGVDYYEVKGPLSVLKASGESGCARCKLLTLSAELFSKHWTLDTEDDPTIILSPPYSSGRVLQVCLKWASSRGGGDQVLWLDVSGEKDEDIPFPKFEIRRHLPANPRSQDISRFHRSMGGLREGNKKPSRLLEIFNMNGGLGLILRDATNSEQKYTALSHCWGSRQEAQKIPVLNEHNLKERLSSVLSVSKLTKTFQDAVDLTNKLGLKYIWIDSLCIIQGDKEDWHRECSKMEYVYGEAYLVIGAAYAKDGNGGLYAPRKTAHRVEFKTPEGHSIRALVRDVSKMRVEHAVWKKAEDFWEADDLPLLSRAWVFQERMLAKRTIYFTARGLVWEYGTCIECECGELQDPRVHWDEFDAGESVERKYRHFVNRGSESDRIQLWCHIVAQYSARGIAYHTDRLPALSSIAKEIDSGEGVLLGRYVCGMWEKTLPLHLIWWSEYKDTSRFPRGESYNPTHMRSTDRRIPSWSWLSIEGRVIIGEDVANLWLRITNIEYRLAGDDPYGECEYAAITIVGAVAPVEVSRRRRDGISWLVVRGQDSKPGGPLLADTQPFEYSDEELQSLG